jgi:voltage-gated potassium channel
MNAESNTAADSPEERQVARQRWALLRRIDAALEIPMLVLGVAWLVLLVAELVWGLSRPLELLGLVIWAAFIAQFLIEITLAPAKFKFLAANWLTVLALLLPALRVFRVFRAVRLLRAARAARGMRLARVVTSLNRGLKALAGTLRRRGFAYVALATVAVTLVGAAGMLTFEGDRPDGFRGYGHALWWTAMLMATMGTDVWPTSPEGRLLCLLLALYAFTVFGYVTATLATFFIGRDAEKTADDAASRELRALRDEVARLQADLRAERSRR